MAFRLTPEQYFNSAPAPRVLKVLNDPSGDIAIVNGVSDRVIIVGFFVLGVCFLGLIAYLATRK